ncbi:oligosaccharide flippase family protein [Neptunicella sp. SCSIO 80796]|uniref:oligosaccharide flippase family protein n=1 Tax=Neptunicella plasticusilytica TaxID=3117012 RepID=UPI003A4D57C2
MRDSAEQTEQITPLKRSNQKVINLIWIFSGNYGNVLFSVLSFLTYAYFLTPEQFGIGIFCIAVVESFGVIYGSTIEDPLVRRPNLRHTDISSTFWIGGALSTITVAVAIVITYLSDYQFIWLMSFCFTKLIMSVLCRPMIAMCRKRRQFKILSIRTLVARFMGTCTGVFIAVQGGGEWALVGQAVFIETFSLMMLLKVSHGYLRAPVSKKAFRRIVREGIPIGLKATFWSMLTRGTIIVLGLVCTPTILGYFGFANRLVRLPLTASTNSLNSYALPVLATKVNNEDDVAEFFSRITLATSAVFMPVFLLGSALAPAFIPMIFGDKWQDSIFIFQCLSLIFGLKFCMIYISKVLSAHGKSKLGLGKEFINLCVFFTVLTFAGPHLGGMAAVLALAIHASTDFFIKTHSLSRLFGLQYSRLGFGLLKIIGCCAAMMFSADQCWQILQRTELFNPVLTFATAVLMGVTTYLALLWLIYPRSFSLLKGLLRK